jgi:hypothetical protein
MENIDISQLLVQGEIGIILAGLIMIYRKIKDMV